METQVSEFLPKVSFEAIPIKDLVTDQQYQRKKSENHVKRATENFDIYQINPVKVSRREGVNYVFNGQHTMEIVARVSGSRDTPVWCMVYDDLYYQHEADIFANQQKYVKALTPYEIFMANVEAGNAKQILIKKLVESYRLSVVACSTDGGICAVSALEDVHDRYGYEILSRTLRLLIAIWDGSQLSLGASFIRGTAQVLAAYGDEIRDDVFIDKLSEISEKQIKREAKERQAGSRGYAETILIAYNKKMHSQLPVEKLKRLAKQKENEINGRKSRDESEQSLSGELQSRLCEADHLPEGSGEF